MAVNPIQEKRIKQYFLEATKEILIGEGISALSVRNVAKRAGYSYATLYNYFKSLSELISFSILDFQKECALHIEEKTKRVASGDRKLKAIVRAYADYFIQYPALFHLFYIEKLSSNKVNRSAALFLNELCQSEFDDSITKGTFTKKEVDLLQEQLRITI
ncbi:MAG: TetR/AcrR family transcriptional regulator, partial [Saprospiraceae bacterium]